MKLKLCAIRSGRTRPETDADARHGARQSRFRVFERNGRRTLETGFTYVLRRTRRPTDRPTVRTERTPQSEEKKKKDIDVDVDEED